MSNDKINGLFEVFGAGAAFFNVIALCRDREVRGVSWFSVVFFTVWGMWNMHYYPSLGQWASWAAPCL